MARPLIGGRHGTGSVADLCWCPTFSWRRDLEVAGTRLHGKVAWVASVDEIQPRSLPCRHGRREQPGGVRAVTRRASPVPAGGGDRPQRVTVLFLRRVLADSSERRAQGRALAGSASPAPGRAPGFRPTAPGRRRPRGSVRWGAGPSTLFCQPADRAQAGRPPGVVCTEAPGHLFWPATPSPEGFAVRRRALGRPAFFARPHLPDQTSPGRVRNNAAPGSRMRSAARGPGHGSPEAKSSYTPKGKKGPGGTAPDRRRPGMFDGEAPVEKEARADPCASTTQRPRNANLWSPNEGPFFSCFFWSRYSPCST